MLRASHYGTDATVFGFGSARSRSCLLTVVVSNMLGVWRMMGMLAVMAVLWMGVLMCMGGVGWVLVVLCVGRGVVVVMVVVGRRVLRDLTVVRMVTMDLGLHRMGYLCCVVQVGWVGFV